ncbi:MAG: YopX family protein [Firmicutes bacterium]|nr:YopX family protein [Bacillota bacterium]
MDMPKFRVWHQMKDDFDAKTKQWTYVWRMSNVQLLNLTAKEVTIESKYGFGNRLYKIGPSCILMQSIGILDIQQKPVFTGDIVKVTELNTTKVKTGVVEDELAVRYIKVADDKMMNWDRYHVEIIGNIYQKTEQ